MANQAELLSGGHGGQDDSTSGPTGDGRTRERAGDFRNSTAFPSLSAKVMPSNTVPMLNSRLESGLRLRQFVVRIARSKENRWSPDVAVSNSLCHFDEAFVEGIIMPIALVSELAFVRG